MPATTRKHLRRGGFTLLELLVVGMLGTIILMFLTNAWRWYGRSVQTARVSDELTRELKLATESIAADFGPALSATSPDGTTLRFAAESGKVVEYAVNAHRLVRRDLDAATEISIADHITALEAETVEGKLQVHLSAAVKQHDQTLTLQLEVP